MEIVVENGTKIDTMSRTKDVILANSVYEPPNTSLQATTPAAFTSVSLRSPSVWLAGVAPELKAVRRCP